MDDTGLKAASGGDLTGVQLRVTDLDWTLGAGEPRCGTGQDLLLVISGPKVLARGLQGTAGERFSSVAA